MKIITNNVPRDIVDAYELTPDERKEFDYLDWQAIEKGEESASFVRYRGEIYDLGDFSTGWGMSSHFRMPDSLKGWDAYITDSFFSGIVVRYADSQYERVVMGRFHG